MDVPLVLMAETEDSALSDRIVRFRRNAEWLTRHGGSYLERHRGRYIAVSEGEVFVSDDAWEARQLARERHAEDEPFVQYIPKERALRIYAC